MFTAVMSVGWMDEYACGKDNRSDTILEQCDVTLEQYDATLE